MKNNEREVEELLARMPRTKKHRKRRRAGKVKVSRADGSVEVVGPGHFYKRRRGQQREKRKTAYERYLDSDHWQRIRQEALKRDKHRCQRCGSYTKLQVHHLTYARIGREWLSDLTTLCRGCHKRHHA